MKPADINLVCLREIEEDDVPRLYEFNLDPEANRMAMTIPRDGDAFKAHCQKIRSNPDGMVKAISLGDVLAGYVCCFKQDGFDAVGYWLGREFWGQGIASRALALFLKEVDRRPLQARVATSNRASLRVLQKCGFIVQSIQITPANDRSPECEVAFVILN